MAVRSILLDTNAYVAFKCGAVEALTVIQHVPVINLNSIILGELLSGFAGGTREAVNLQELQQFCAARRVHFLPVDNITAEYYATVYRQLKSKGNPIPTNDMWIAATALQYGLAVFSYDRHLQAVDQLVVGKQLADFML